MAIVNKYNIDMVIKKENEREKWRHKCSICGKIRYEKFMLNICYSNGTIVKTRYGYDCWCCRKKECMEKSEYFNSY